jgi:hypothetical protein
MHYNFIVTCIHFSRAVARVTGANKIFVVKTLEFRLMAGDEGFEIYKVYLPHSPHEALGRLTLAANYMTRRHNRSGIRFAVNSYSNLVI